MRGEEKACAFLSEPCVQSKRGGKHDDMKALFLAHLFYHLVALILLHIYI